MPPELRPAIVQDARNGRVLMLAWMNDEALQLTVDTGEAWFWSRSRERLWKKGETSGNTLAVEELRGDCDGDAVLLRVIPNGPACHTSSASCFAPALWRTVVERVRDRPRGSYVAELASGGVVRAAQKVGEEAVETALAAANLLEANGGRTNERAALTHYNRSPLYRNAVLHLAHRMTTVPTALREYYAWKLYLKRKS